jgi:hypothetical protein
VSSEAPNGGQELAGADQPPVFKPQPGQRFHGGGLTRVQIDQRLIVHFQTAAEQAVAPGAAVLQGHGGGFAPGHQAVKPALEELFDAAQEAVHALRFELAGVTSVQPHDGEHAAAVVFHRQRGRTAHATLCATGARAPCADR